MSKDEKTESTLVDTEEKVTTKTTKKELHEAIKGGTTISFPKVATTTLTAVSMAVISTQLTSVVNGLLLAGLVSLIAAFMGEIYRVIFSVTAIGTKKAIKPLVKTPNGDAAIVVAEEDEPTPENEQRHGLALRDKFQSYLKTRPHMRFALLFTAVASITVASAYITASALQQPVFNQYFPTKVNAQTISDAEKQQIIDEAIAQSQNNQGNSNGSVAPSDDASEKPTETPTEKASKTSNPKDEKPQDEATTPNSSEETTNQNPPAYDDGDLKKKIEDLEDKIEDLENASNTKDETPPKTEEEPPETTAPKDEIPTDTTKDEEITELKEQVAELQKQMDDMNKNPEAAPTSKPKETTTPQEQPTSEAQSAQEPSVEDNPTESASPTESEAPASSSSAPTQSSSEGK